MTNQKYNISILVAEDDPDDRCLIKDAFDEAEITNPLFFVEDGEELMDFLYNKNKFLDKKRFPRPGLILLDLNMPKKDGRQALSEIKSDKELKKIPVTILSTSDNEEDIINSYILGVNSFITKPQSFNLLVEVMRSIKNYWLNTAELPVKSYEEKDER